MDSLNKIYKALNYQTLFLLSVFVIMPLIFVSGLQDVILLPRLIFLTLVIFTGIIYLFFKKEPLKLFIVHPVVYLFFGFVFISALSGFVSINKAESIFETGKLALCFFVFLFLTQLFLLESKGIIIFAKCIVVSVIVHGLLMVSEFFIDKIELTQYKSLCEFTALMGNKNIFCEYMLCCLPFCIYCFWGIGNRAWEVLSLLGIFLIIISSVFLQTRSVWVAIFLLAIVLAILIIMQRKNMNFKNLICLSL